MAQALKMLVENFGCAAEIAALGAEGVEDLVVGFCGRGGGGEGSLGEAQEGGVGVVGVRTATRLLEGNLARLRSVPESARG